MGKASNNAPYRDLARTPGRTLYVLAGITVCAVPLGPTVLVAYLTRWWLGTVLTAMCLIFLLFGVGLRKKPAAWVTVAAVPYWLAVLVMQAFFVPFAWVMNPAYCALAMFLSLLALLPGWGKTLATVVSITAILMLAGFSAADLFSHSRAAMLLALGAGVAVAASALWFGRRGLFSNLSGLAIALFVFNLMVYPRGLLFYSVPFPGDLDRILSQPGVRAIYTYEDPEDVMLIPSHIMYMARLPGTGTFLLGPHDPNRHLHFFTPGDPPVDVRIDLGSRGGNNPVFDPEDPSILYVLGRNHLHRVFTETPAISDTLDLGSSNWPLSYFRYDQEADFFVAGRAMDRQVFLIDRKSLEVRRSFSLRRWEVVSDVWFDPGGDQVFVAGLIPFGWVAATYDATTMERKRTALWPIDHVYECTIDPVGRRAYMASFLWGHVLVVDLDTLETVDRFRLDVGIRSLNFDPVRRWVLVSSFYQGREYVYDVDRREIVGSLFLGKRVRWMEVDSETGTWYATSSAGGFEINPEKAFGLDRSPPAISVETGPS